MAIGCNNSTSIRAVVDCPGGGRVITLGIPGLAIRHDGTAWLCPEDSVATLTALKALNAVMFVLLAEDTEFPRGVRLALRGVCRQKGMQFIGLPIVDFSVPTPAWQRAWRKIEKCLHQQLDGGAAIALCCLYGAGRSGMIAAMLLQARGLSVNEALSSLRNTFPESVESPVQEAWLERRGA